MNKKLQYLNINACDYKELTRIMTDAFNEDTRLHTDLEQDGPDGYNDGTLIKWLNENKSFESYKVIYKDEIVGAYSVGIKRNNEYSLEMLFIDPKYRQEHLGSIVWKDIEQKYANAKKWTVETPDYSKRNHHFYTKKCGFVFRRQKVYQSGDKSFIFEKIN